MIKPSADFSELTVMVIDDDECMLTIMGMLVKNLGVKKLHIMEHSLEAIKLIKDTHIDVIISDVNMPECDGFELCNHLAHLGYKGVLSFATASDKLTQECLITCNELHQLNLVSVMSKPINIGKIDEVLL